MGEAKTIDESAAELDPGAYIGREPELEAETIPGGVGPQDERVAAYDSRPGIGGEPDMTDASKEASRGDRK